MDTKLLIPPAGHRESRVLLELRKWTRDAKPGPIDLRGME